MNDGLVVLPDEPLARHTAWRIGGRCDALVWVHRRDGLVRVIDECRAVGWKWTLLGAGTRTLVRDGGIPGVVVRLGTDFAGLDTSGEVWQVGAAVPVPAVVGAALAAGRGGLEGVATVPGSVGASLQLDEGWGGVVEEVRYLHRGREQRAALEEVQGRDRVVLGCTLRLGAADPDRARKAVRAALTGGRGLPPSSWYAAPPRGSLRKILGSVELPRVRLRKVAIPDAAPEVLVNLGEGSAADLALLHRSAIERVKRGRGVTLEPRLRWIGARLARDEA